MLRAVVSGYNRRVISHLVSSWHNSRHWNFVSIDCCVPCSQPTGWEHENHRLYRGQVASVSCFNRRVKTMSLCDPITCAKISPPDKLGCIVFTRCISCLIKRSPAIIKWVARPPQDASLITRVSTKSKYSKRTLSVRVSRH